jgi:hypothetical protein
MAGATRNREKKGCGSKAIVHFASLIITVDDDDDMLYGAAMRIALLLASSLCVIGLGCASTDDGARSGAGGSSNTGGSSSGGSTAAGGSTGTGGGSSGGSTGTGGDVSGGSTGDGGSTGTGGDVGSDGGEGAPDATGSGGSSGVGQGCAGVTAKFCEDFEKQADGQEPTGDFTVDVNNGATLVVDGSKPYSGTKSAHIKLPKVSSDTNAQMVWTKQFPFASNDIHGRAMVFLVKIPPGNNLHWDLTTAFASGGIEYTIGSMYGNFMPVYQPGDDSVDTNTPFPVGKWGCIQWEFRKGGAGDLLKVMLDGQVTDQGEVTKWKAGAWNKLNFGWINFQSATGDVEMWFDDIAFGEQEIPCPPAK